LVPLGTPLFKKKCQPTGKRSRAHDRLGSPPHCLEHL
jgi:hypothetical protein